MEKVVFDINKFNLIEDDENYYFFRSLNNGDHNDIINKITSNENGIQRIRTDRERFEENNEKAKYSSESEISLEEVWDHIKIRYSKETNCISLSANSNVSIDYGQLYNEEYAMIKVPKQGKDKIYNAPQYMLEEVNKIIEKELKLIPQDSDVMDIIKRIDEEKSYRNVKAIVANVYDGIKKVDKQYSGRNNNIKSKRSVVSRLDKRQYFSDAQQLEYNKIIAKLSVLEANGKLRSIIPTNADNTSLIRTIGIAFSSGELIHYKDIQSTDIIQVPKEMMDILSLVQQLKDKGMKDDSIKALEQRVIRLINNRYEIKKENDNCILTNGTDSIKTNGNLEDIIISKNILSIEEVYNATKGRISYEKAKIAIEFATKLSQSRIRAIDYSNVIKTLTNGNVEIAKRIEEECFVIDKDIISRENNIGLKIAESVNIGLTNEQRSYISNDEQIKVIESIKRLNLEQLKKAINTEILSTEINILNNILDKKEKIPENQYFAEAIVDGLDFGKIYKTISEEKRIITEDERKILVDKLNNVDCQKLYNSFLNAGVIPNEISGYIINLLMDNGYKEHTLENLAQLDKLDEIINKNVRNLNNRIQALRLDTLLEIKDDSYIVPETDIKLRDYQNNTLQQIKEIFGEKRFAGMILPTGAGKSFVAMAEMMDFRNSNIIFIAPQNTVLSQFQSHIIKNILKKQNVQIKNYSKVIEEAFPHLKMYCYDTIGSRDEEWLKSHDADFIVLDELHRSGAETWYPQIKKLIDNNSKAKILGMTATPIRDVDNKDMARELAEMTEEYTQVELMQKKYLASEMHLLDAMQDDIVVSPRVVTFDYTLGDSEEYKEIKRMEESEQDPYKKEELKRIYKEITQIIKNSEKEGINKILANNIKKKNGRYIVFLPNNNTELSSEDYMKVEIEKVKEYFKDIDPNPETSYLLSNRMDKKENLIALESFETSNSEHLKLIFALNMLNEGVHVNDIDGVVMLRPISENSKILYLQQIGRCIYSLDPNKPISDEDRPLIFDVYNNYLAQNMDREANRNNQTSDLQRLQTIVNWIKDHKGYMPDINSENIREARRAIALKNIQKKYRKYIDGIENKNLSESEIFEIHRIVELGKDIDLWNLEIPDRIIPPGEKDISRNNTFKVTGTQKEFIELFKKARSIEKDRELSDKLRIKNGLSVLDFLTEYGIEISNKTIEIEDSLEKVLKVVSKETRKTILEEIEEFGINKDFKIGQEYNYVKEKFYNGEKIFEDYELVDLRKYGIFGLFIDTIKQELRKVLVDNNLFITKNGPKKFLGLNLDTGTQYDKEGYNKFGYDRLGYDKEGFDYNGYDKEGYKKDGYDKEGYDKDGYNINGYNREGYNKDGYNRYGYDIKGYDKEGFDYNGYDKKGYYKDGYNKEGIHKTTQTLYDEEGYNRKGFNKEGIHKTTQTLYNEKGYDIKGYDKEGFDYNGYDRDGYNRYGYDREGYNIEGYNRDGYNKEGIHKTTQTLYDKEGYNKAGYNIKGFDYYGYDRDGYDENGYNRKGYDKEGYNRKGFNKDGIHKTTQSLYNEKGYDIKGYDKEGYDRDGYNRFGYDRDGYKRRGYDKEGYNRDGYNKEGIHKTTQTLYNEKGYDIKGYDKEGYDKKGFNKDGIYKTTQTLYDEDGYDKDGYDKAGLNKEGSDLNGYDREGYDEFGYDREGYNIEGYDKDGYNRFGYDREGYNIYGYDQEGYFCEKQEDGEYKNTGLKYNKYGFKADRRHIITKTAIDLRRFDINGKCKSNNDNGYDENGFKQDGTHIETGGKYYNGYNAFGVDENGKKKNGREDTDITFTKEYINGIFTGKRLEILKKYHLDKMGADKINTIVYRASEMYPDLKKQIYMKIYHYQRQIQAREKEIEQLDYKTNEGKAKIEMLKQENIALKQRISFMDPTNEIYK